MEQYSEATSDYPKCKQKLEKTSFISSSNEKQGGFKESFQTSRRNFASKSDQ